MALTNAVQCFLPFSASFLPYAPLGCIVVSNFTTPPVLGCSFNILDCDVRAAAARHSSAYCSEGGQSILDHYQQLGLCVSATSAISCVPKQFRCNTLAWPHCDGIVLLGPRGSVLRQHQFNKFWRLPQQNVTLASGNCVPGSLW